jgi:hypothetical protein
MLVIGAFLAGWKAREVVYRQDASREWQEWMRPCRYFAGSSLMTNSFFRSTSTESGVLSMPPYIS